MFLAQSSPYLKPELSVSKMMLVVTLLMIPGILTSTYIFGYGVLVNIFLAIVFALGFEAAILYLRKRPIKVYLKDKSALLTAVIIGVSLPPSRTLVAHFYWFILCHSDCQTTLWWFGLQYL